MSTPGVSTHCGFVGLSAAERLLWAEWLMLLLGACLVGLFLGWVLARWLRIRHRAAMDGRSTRPPAAEAWTESARRMVPDEGVDDPEQPPGGPRSDPGSRWWS